MDPVIEGVQLHLLRIIPVEKGNVMHAMKRSDPGFDGFGEAYFSKVDHQQTKGWKKHTQMTLNLVVPVGSIQFVLFDDRENSDSKGKVESFTLGEDNYGRLTVPPGIFVAFRGLEKANMLLNLASIEHQPDEAINLPLENEKIEYEW